MDEHRRSAPHALSLPGLRILVVLVALALPLTSARACQTPEDARYFTAVWPYDGAAGVPWDVVLVAFGESALGEIDLSCEAFEIRLTRDGVPVTGRGVWLDPMASLGWAPDEPLVPGAT